jgi:hypothetical protein
MNPETFSLVLSDDSGVFYVDFTFDRFIRCNGLRRVYTCPFLTEDVSVDNDGMVCLKDIVTVAGFSYQGYTKKESL